METPPLARPKVLYVTFVQAIFLQSHAAALTPRLRERLFQCGLDLDRVEPMYRADHLPLWLKATAEEVHPGLPEGQAFELMGRQCMEGWRQTLLGRAVTMISRFVPPKTALIRLEASFRGLDNFTRVDFLDRGPTELDVTFRDALGVPDFFLGFMRAGATLSSARNPRVELLRHEPPSATFRCSWDG